MAARRQYDDPLTQLMALLPELRSRGLPFDDAWEVVRRPGHRLLLVTDDRRAGLEDCVRWPSDRSDRLSWQAAIDGSREAYRRAYEGTPPTRGDTAMKRLGPEFGRLVGGMAA